jgi:hypothetical protein
MQSSKVKLLASAAFVSCGLLLCAAAANASPVVFTGVDDGAPTTGPFTNSAAAQASFETAASGLGSISTIDFESQAVGFSASFTAAPGVTVSLNAPNFGNGFSGVSNATFGNLYGFNTTSGGSNWLGFSGGSATFDFSQGTQSFGFYVTGVQTVFSSAIDVTFSDGTSEDLTIPLTVNGGAEYFGFTDAGKLISSITIANISDDAWGIDDVTYNSAAAVPEPLTLSLFGMGLAGMGAMRRRRRAKNKA